MEEVSNFLDISLNNETIDEEEKKSPNSRRSSPIRLYA